MVLKKNQAAAHGRNSRITSSSACLKKENKTGQPRLNSKTVPVL